MVKEIRFIGNNTFVADTLLRFLPFTTGSSYSRPLVLEGRYHISNFYLDNGFKYVKIKHETLTDESSGNYIVVYQINEGIKTYIGQITIKGNTKTRDNVIERELLFHTGDLYRRKNILASQSRLLSLNYFEHVRIDEVHEAYPEEATETIDFTVEVTEQKTGLISIGAGYSTQEGIRGYARYRQSNLFGKGQRFSAGVKWSEKGEALQRSREIRLDFYEPHLWESDIGLGLEGYFRRENFDNYDLERLGGDIYLTRNIFDTRTKGTLKFRVETDRTFNIENTIDTTVIALEDKSDLVTELSLELIHDRRDNLIYPSHGAIYSMDLGLVSEAFGGDFNFVKMELDGRWYIPIKPPKWVLGLRVNSEYLESFGSTDEIPIYERVFAGGADSVRGFKERYLGPLDLDGFPTGGELSLIYNAEFRFPIYKSFTGVAFYDAGYVWDSPDDFDLSDIEHAVGTGIRYITPIGPLRLDYGIRLPKVDNGRFYLSVGHTF